MAEILTDIIFALFCTAIGLELVKSMSLDNSELKSFIKKTGIIYLIGTIVYLPVALKGTNNLPTLLYDFAFQGISYHLWLFPALMLGAAISGITVRKKGFKAGFITGGILLLLGILKGMTGGGYCGMGVLRGLLIGPLFFTLGGYINERKVEEHSLKAYRGEKAGENPELSKEAAPEFIYFLVSFYILTPLFLRIFREGSVFSLMGVTALLLSALVSFLVLFLIKIWKGRHPSSGPDPTDRAWVEVDLNNLRHNVKALTDLLPEGCEMMAVVKAEAYGLHAFSVSSELSRVGVKHFAVATLDEGIELRHYGIKGEILVLGYTPVRRAPELRKYDITQTLVDRDYGEKLNAVGIKVKGQVKVDTGMHRIGIFAEDTDSVASLFSLENVEITGMYSHLCVADGDSPSDRDFTLLQIERFNKLAEELKNKGITIPKLHIQSSYGLMNYPELKYDYFRAGIILYGVLTSYGDKPEIMPDLRPVLSLKSRLILLRNIKAGETVGYGRTWAAPSDRLIGVVSIGYADGLPRNLSNEGHVLINGKAAPIIGRICMDQLMVDLHEFEDDVPETGAEVTLIGRDNSSEVGTCRVARDSDSITHELLSRMGGRLGVEITDSAK